MIELLDFVVRAIGLCKSLLYEYYPMCIGLCVIATIPCIVRKAVKGK